MEAIILLGGPGAGKGTLAGYLKQHTSYLHVSTGDMFRDALASNSKIGQEIRRYMDAGNLVPDSVVLDVIAERIQQESPDTQFMFDGFPRTLNQAEGLAQIAAKENVSISHVLNLDVSRETLIPRLSGRRVCKSCGAVYHVINKPPQQAGVCDVDGGELYQRKDDCEETIINRLDVYDKQTHPLIEYYKSKGLMRMLNAEKSPEEIGRQALAVLEGSAQ